MKMDHLGISLVILLGVVLTGTAFGAASPAPGSADTLRRADALHQEKSFRLARELYEKLLASGGALDAETRTHAKVFALDCQWRENPGGEPSHQAEKELGRMLEDLPADSRWRAEAAESLGDLRQQLGAWNQRQGAVEDWLIALKYWSEAPDMTAAAPRYVALNFRIADQLSDNYGGGIIPYPQTPAFARIGILPPPPPPDRIWEGDLPSWAMRNVLRVSKVPAERAHALFRLGALRTGNTLNWITEFTPDQGMQRKYVDNLKNPDWEKEGEAYLKQAAALRPVNEWTDKALYTLAEYYNNHQRYVEAAKVLQQFVEQFKRAQSQYFDQAIGLLRAIEDPAAQIQTGDLYAPGSYLRVQLDYRNIDRATLRVYKVTVDDYLQYEQTLKHGAAPDTQPDAKVLERPFEGITDEKKHIPHQQTIYLKPLPPGLYVAELMAPLSPADPRPHRVLFRVSRLALAGRNVVEGQDQIFAADAESGKPVAGARVWALYKPDGNQQGSWTLREGKTDASGVAKIQRPPAPANRYGSLQVHYYAEHEGHFATTQQWGQWSRPSGGLAEREQWMIYATADRPAYRPGDAIQWKAVLRVRDGKGYRLPALEKVYVTVHDGRGQMAYEGEHTINEYGSITGSFSVDRKAALGVFNMTVLEKKDQPALGHAALCRLEEYKLPEYKVSVEPGSEQARFGAAVPFDVKAEYYFGGPVAGAEVEVIVHRRAFWPGWKPSRPYRWLYENGDSERMEWMPWFWPRSEPENVVLTKNLKTDAQGKAHVEVGKLGEEEIRQARDRGIWGYEYRVEARVVDSSRREVRESGSVKVAQTAFAAYLNPRRYLYLPGDPIRIDLKTLDPNDRPVAAEGFVTMYKRTWNKDKVDAQGAKIPGYDDARLLARPAITDAKTGAGELEFSPDEPGCYLFRFETKDRFGADVKGETVVFVARQDTRNLGYRSGGVTIITDKDTYTRGETAHVLLTVRRPGAAVWFGVESETVNSLRVVPIEGAVKLVDVPVTADCEPNIFFTATAIFDYAAFQDRRRIVVPPQEQFLDVTIKAPKESFKPGEKASVEVEVKDNHGQPVKTELALGMADAAVWAIQGDLAADIRQAFWSRTRRLALNVVASPTQQGTQRWRPKKDKPDEFEEEGELARQTAEQDEMSSLDASSGLGRNRGYARRMSFGGGMGGGARGGLAFSRAMPAAAPAPMGAAMAEAPMMMKAAAVDRVGTLADKAEASEAMQPAQLRTNFSATALWLPTLKTGDDGKARAEVTFPDSLTTWKLTARAADKQTRVGELRREVKTTKPLLVRPQGPRFFTQGDVVTLSAIVNNNTTASLVVEVTLDVKGLGLRSFKASQLVVLDLDADTTTPVEGTQPTMKIRVPAQGQRRVDWRVDATAPGTAVIKTTALSKVDSDAVEKSFPVYEYGIEQFIAGGAVLKGAPGTLEKTITLNIPEARRPGSEGLTIWIEPTLARTMVNALDYLAQYPYGCVEQTLSRFVPAVITARTLRQLGLHKPDLEKTLPDMIQAGLSRLEDMQHTDGGWGWWKEGESDLYMTAYVMQGLHEAEAAGVEVKTQIMSRATNFLTQNLVKAQDQPDLTAFMLYALTPGPAVNIAGGDPIPLAYNRLWAQRDKLNPYSRALFTLACQRTAQPQRASTLSRNLRNGLIEDKPNGTAHWGSSGIFYHWSEGGVESTAFAMRALLAAEPGSNLIDPAMTWLVRNRRGNRWESTKDTALAIRALGDYITQMKEDKPDWTAEVEVNGQRVTELRAEPGKVFEFEGKVVVPASALRTGENKIVIRRKGSGVLYASAWLTYFTREQQIKAAGNEVFAQRKYFRTTQVPTLAGTYKTTREELKPGMALKSGDRIEVELSLEAKNNYEYVVVEDLKAAGMEPTEVKSGYAWGGGLSAHRELRDEKTAFFITNLPEGKHTLTYELRAEIPGVFSALPTLAHAMYVPEIRANSAGAKVEIRD